MPKLFDEKKIHKDVTKRAEMKKRLPRYTMRHLRRRENIKKKHFNVTILNLITFNAVMSSVTSP